MIKEEIFQALRDSWERDELEIEQFSKNFNSNGPKYQVIRRQTLNSLIFQVNVAVIEGWHPVGGIVTMIRKTTQWNKVAEHDTWYMQAIIRGGS